MNMDTMVGTIPMNAVLTMLNSLSRHDRRWLAEQLSAQVEREEAEAKAALTAYRKNALTWKEEDNARLDEFLQSISGDWGGEGTPTGIANELRQGADMARKVEVW